MEVEANNKNSAEICTKNKRVMYKLQKMKTGKDNKTTREQNPYKSLSSNENNKIKTMRSIPKNISIINEDQAYKELEDPNNEYIKEPLENIIHIKHQIASLSFEYDRLKINKQADAIDLLNLEKKHDKSIEMLYHCKPYPYKSFVI